MPTTLCHSSPTRILLLRHAETAAPDLFHGSESDVALGLRGLEQARAVARRIAAERPQSLYSSRMRRAVETAEILALAIGLPPQTWPDLHERRMGPLSGRPRGEGWRAYEDAKSGWMSGRLDATHDGGESFAEIRDRAVASFQRLVEREAGGTVVLVTHGVLNRVLLTSILEGRTPTDFDAIPIDFVGVHDVRWDGSTFRLADYWPGDVTPPPRPSPSSPP